VIETGVPKKKKHRFARFMAWFLGIILGLEIILRLFGYGSYVLYQPDRDLLWVPVPGSHKITETNHLPININDEGFRYPRNVSQQHDGIYRVMTFGDSVTMGWGVSDDATYSLQLEKLLNGNACGGKQVQVIDGGVNAYPNALAAARLKKSIVDNYQPDAVVLAYAFNTGFEKFAELQGKDREQFLHRVEMKSVARRSALYNFLIEDLLRQVMYYRFRELLLQGSWDTAKQHQVIDVDKFTAGLVQAKEAADSHHVQLVLLLLGSEGETAPAHPYQKAMQQFAQQNNVPIVDMIAWQNGKNQKGFFMDHVHPTAEGHALIAQQIASTMQGLDSYKAACQDAKNGSMVMSKQQ